MQKDYQRYRYITAQPAADGGYRLTYDLNGKTSQHPSVFSSRGEIDEFINRFSKPGDSDYYKAVCEEGASVIYQRNLLPKCLVDKGQCSYWCISHDMCQWGDQ